MTNWKEYITIDTLTLVISIATLVVSIAALIVAKRAYNYNHAKDIQVLKTTIAQKEAQLDSMKTAFRFGFIGDNGMAANKISLKKEIDILKRL